MKKVFLALMAVAAIAMIGCEGRHYVDDPNEKEPPENDRTRFVLEDGAFDTFPYNQHNTGSAPVRMTLKEARSQGLYVD